MDQLIFVSQAGRNRHEDICESMELFAREVMGEFHDRAEEVERSKAGRLAPAIERALERRRATEGGAGGLHVPGSGIPVLRPSGPSTPSFPVHLPRAHLTQGPAPEQGSSSSFVAPARDGSCREPARSTSSRIEIEWAR